MGGWGREVAAQANRGRGGATLSSCKRPPSCRTLIRARFIPSLSPPSLSLPPPLPPADSELRQDRVGEFRVVYSALAEAEEAEYLAAKKAAALR